MDGYKVIKQLLDDGKITQDEYDILFEDKSNWYTEYEHGDKNWSKSKSKLRKFDTTLKNIINLQQDLEEYNLSRIVFPFFNFEDFFQDNKANKPILFFKARFSDGVNFGNAKFSGQANFVGATFEEKVYFKSATFSNGVSFSGVNFIDEVYFKSATFSGDTNFISTTFKNEAYFELAKFNNDTYFDEAVFEGGAIFNNVEFIGEASFYKTYHEKEAEFTNTTFYESVSFRYSVFKDGAYFNDLKLKKYIDLSLIDFEKEFNAENMSFNLLDIKGTYFEQPILLGLSAYEKEHKIPLEPKHFVNKESARLIKDHFEKQNNITEANKYFVIEQEKYIEELKSNENMADDNKVRKLIPLYSNKIISHFGTDWVRAILFLMLWGIIADHMFLIIKKYSLVFDWKYFVFSVIVALSYIITYAHNAKDKILKELFFGLLLFIYILFVFNNDLNHIVKLLNPINAFKEDETFKGYEAFGAMVRIISATIIYQIIVAFRQFTRRG